MDDWRGKYEVVAELGVKGSFPLHDIVRLTDSSPHDVPWAELHIVCSSSPEPDVDWALALLRKKPSA